MYLTSAVAFALSLPIATASLYSKSSPVLQLDQSSYNKIIAKSNYTSIVEFYAPWCGHCKNLAPAYDKAAASLSGLANVAAVNCDEESNKPFCGQMGVQGFPTLKIVKPAQKKDGKKAGKAKVEDYQGARTAKAIIDAVKDKMPNHVTRVKDDTLEEWLSKDKGRSKALVFGDKGLVPAIAKALAIDFLGSIDIGYARSADKQAMKKYGVSEFPTVLLIPSAGADAIKYDGENKKGPLVEFLSQAATPNPDGQASVGKSNTKAKPKPKKKSGEKKKAQAHPNAAEGDAAKCPHAAGATHNPHAASETLEDEVNPTESPSPDAAEGKAKPVDVPVTPAPKLQTLDSETALQKGCLSSKSSTCVIAISAAQEDVALAGLAEIAHKHSTHGSRIFPFYSVPESNPGAKTLLEGLQLGAVQGAPKFLAVNAKRGWWKPYHGETSDATAVEQWIDAIRFGEGKKLDLPEALVSQVEEEAAKEEVKDKHDEL